MAAHRRRTAISEHNSTGSRPFDGVKKAVVAVAASIPTTAYFILRDGVDHRDLGPEYLDRR
jgi:hypothetical protein